MKLGWIIKWKCWNWRQTKFLMRLNYLMNKRELDALAQRQDSTQKLPGPTAGEIQFTKGGLGKLPERVG